MNAARTIALLLVSSTLAFAGGYAVGVRGSKPAMSVDGSSAKSIASNAASATHDAGDPVADSNQLEKELSDARIAIVKLQQMNQSLSRQIEQMNLPLPASTTYPELLNKIDKLPRSLITEHLKNLFGDEYAAQIADPYGFSKQLVEVALSENGNEQADGSVFIEFSYSPLAGIRLIPPVAEVDQFDTLYAHFSSSVDCENCMVKWQYSNSGEILLFKPIHLTANGETQYVWSKPNSGWRIGDYQVTVYDMDDNRYPVGAGGFHVVNVRLGDAEKAANGPDADVIRDLVVSGQAVRKQ